MPLTSKTGLLPTVTRRNKTEIQATMILEIPNFARPAPFMLRPFAGVYNPFPYGCSILCNHPADLEAKSVVKKAKDAWTTEGKSLLDLDELSVLERQEKANQNFFPVKNENQNEVPEELFRKYTDTDSRPLTPAPTLASFGTKASQTLKARRCMTPDPTSLVPTKEKTFLVLDLRRSHSQETVCWLGGPTASDSLEDVGPQEPTTSRTPSPSGQNASQPKKKKTPRRKTPTTTPSLKSENSRDSDSKVHTRHSSGSQSPSKASLIQEQPPVATKAPQTSPDTDSVDVDGMKRRGKKRKGKKIGKDGEKAVKGIPDPGETQVSALEDDSKDGSSRASLAEEENQQALCSEDIASANPEAESSSEEMKKSFLKAEILKQLQRQLDQEVVDSELNAKRKVALEEALKCKTHPKHAQQGEEMKQLKKEFQLAITNSEKWLCIPRVFTRRSARFELPMDSRLLDTMTPLHYVQNYVFASPERLVLYNHLFNLYKEEPEDDDEDTDRVLLGKNVILALGKIMGTEVTREESQNFQDLVDWKDDAALDFRTFAGISATCERLLGPRFCSKMSTQKEDPRHELEVADFESLEDKLRRLSPDPKLVGILRAVRDL